MQRIEIRRPRMEDREELSQFFKIVIEDTFQKEGLTELMEELKEEIQTKETFLEEDFESNGKNRYFLIAINDNKIIGSIVYGLPNDIIIEASNGELKDVVEVGTVFVHPVYQRQGVGNLLLHEMYDTLHSKGIHEFSLDSGYKNAQKIWIKKFGNPQYWLRDYWGKGSDHMIWKISLENVFNK